MESDALPGQRTVTGTPAGVAEARRAEAVDSPVRVVVGEGVRLREQLAGVGVSFPTMQ